MNLSCSPKFLSPDSPRLPLPYHSRGGVRVSHLSLAFSSQVVVPLQEKLQFCG